MGRTCFCSVQERSVARTTVSAFVMKLKFRHKSRLTGLIPAANDTIQRINMIIRYQLGNGGNKICNSSGRKRGYRCLPFSSPSVPPTHMHFGPHQPVLSGKKTRFQMLLPNLRNVYCCSGYVQEEGEGKAVRNFQQFLLGEGPPNFLKGAIEEGGEKARGSVPF